MCEEATEIPEACLTPLELPCGACNEGRRYESCDGLCNVGSSECYGRGCTPGAITRTTEGCPDGEFKDVVCSESCEPTDAACGPFLPDVDIMLLVDTTGSHTTVVRNNATVLATELVAPLLADSDVRVGIATFADFPVGSYGRSGDTPFSAVQELTDDLALVSSTIEVLPAQAGADGPESVVEALHVLAGGDPHPLSQPLFTCPSGTGRGGCWRPGSQRVIVLLTDASQHNIPHLSLIHI